MSGVYGIYATLNDFHENKHGKSVLTNKGRAGIALLVFSTLLSLSSDTIKDTRESRQAKADEAKREELLREARRASSPFSLDRIRASVQTLLPIDSKLVETYLRRAVRFRGSSDTATYITQHSTEFPEQHNPQESELFSLVTNMVVGVHIYKAHQETQSAQDPVRERIPDLSLMLGCKKIKKEQHVDIFLDIWWGNPFDGSTSRDASRFTIECETDNIDVADNHGTFQSLLDFAGATVNVGIQGAFGTRNEAVPLVVGLKTNNGREIQFVNFSHNKTCVSECFTTTMPSDFK